MFFKSLLFGLFFFFFTFLVEKKGSKEMGERERDQDRLLESNCDGFEGDLDFLF